MKQRIDTEIMGKLAQMIFGIPDEDISLYNGEKISPSPAIREKCMGIFRRHMRMLNPHEATAELTEIQSIWKRGLFHGLKFHIMWQETATILWDEKVANERDKRSWFPPIELIIEMMCTAHIHFPSICGCLINSSPPPPRLAPHDRKIPNAEFTERYLLQTIRDGLILRKREDLLLKPDSNGI